MNKYSGTTIISQSINHKKHKSSKNQQIKYIHTSISFATMHMNPELIRRTNTTVLELLSPEDQNQIAEDYLELGQNLIWEEEDYDQAIEVLQSGLAIQQRNLGKNHIKVGCTCSLIGTAYLLQGKSMKDALKYFLEARRIYSKSPRDESRVHGADQRIHTILKRMGLISQEIEMCQTIIEHTIAHGLKSDLLKEKGLSDLAKRELDKARTCSASLMELIA